MLGILLATLAQLAGALGKILMKKAHTLSGWQARTCNLAAFVSIIILNPVCGLAAYAYAAQSLLAPLSVLNLVWNAVLAWVLLGEVLRTRGILAYCLICVGTLEAASHGIHVARKYTYAELVQLYSERAFIVYAIVQVAVLAALAAIVRADKSRFSAVVREISWGSLAGLISGNQFLSKSVSVLLRAHAQGMVHWWNLEFWAIIIGTIIVAVGGIVILKNGLKEFQALTLIPIFQSCFVINNVASGLIYFQEHRQFTRSMVVHYAIAFVFIFAGIAITAADGSVAKASGGTAPSLRKKPSKPVIHPQPEHC